MLVCFWSVVKSMVENLMYEEENLLDNILYGWLILKYGIEYKIYLVKFFLCVLLGKRCANNEIMFDYKF